jgi:transglutaminase-like putative cysteine protease
LPLSGCSRGSKSPPASATVETPASSDSGEEKKGSRDNTPQVLTPSADGETVYKSEVSVIDASNVSEGYIMVKYKGSNSKVKLQITGPDQVTYTYDLHGGYEVFPLTAGDGSYTVSVFENVSDNQYATAQSETVSVELSNKFGPYLYPSQYVNFTADSLPVAKAEELAKNCDSDLEVVSAVYNYIIDNFSYDYDKAASVKSGYLPVVDDVFKSNTGICFDYTAVIATMLRTQGIPTRLEVGYMGEQYHSWVSIYTKETGWINGIIEFDGKDWKMLDPTFASTSKDPESFTTENSKYTTKYVY